MRLSIIIVSYNAREDLARCLDSLRAAPPVIPHEIVVADNASTDGSRDVVAARPGIRLLALPANIGFAAAAFALMLFCYSRGLMGGGDLKLLTVAFLWTGMHCVLPFLIVLVIFASLHTLAAKLDWVDAQRVNGRIKVAFAPSVAAGLIGVFLSGCLAPP